MRSIETVKKILKKNKERRINQIKLYNENRSAFAHAHKTIMNKSDFKEEEEETHISISLKKRQQKNKSKMYRL